MAAPSLHIDEVAPIQTQLHLHDKWNNIISMGRGSDIPCSGTLYPWACPFQNLPKFNYLQIDQI